MTNGKICIRLCNRPITVSSFPWHSMQQRPSIKDVVIGFRGRLFHYFILAWRHTAGMFCDGGIAIWGLPASRKICLAFKQGEWICSELVLHHFLHGEISCLGYDNEYLKQQGGIDGAVWDIGTGDECPRVLALSLRLKENWNAAWLTMVLIMFIPTVLYSWTLVSDGASMPVTLFRNDCSWKWCEWYQSGVNLGKIMYVSI